MFSLRHDRQNPFQHVPSQWPTHYHGYPEVFKETAEETSPFVHPILAEDSLFSRFIHKQRKLLLVEEASVSEHSRQDGLSQLPQTTQGSSYTETRTRSPNGEIDHSISRREIASSLGVAKSGENSPLNELPRHGDAPYQLSGQEQLQTKIRLGQYRLNEARDQHNVPSSVNTTSTPWALGRQLGNQYHQ